MGLVQGSTRVDNIISKPLVILELGRAVQQGSSDWWQALEADVPEAAADRFFEGLDGDYRCYTLSVDAVTRAERRWPDVAVGLTAVAVTGTASLPTLESLLSPYKVRFPSEKERNKRGAGRETVCDINKQEELDEQLLRIEALRPFLTAQLSSNAHRFLELHVIDLSFPVNRSYVCQDGDRCAAALKNNSTVFISLSSVAQEEVRGWATSIEATVAVVEGEKGRNHMKSDSGVREAAEL